MKKRLYIAIVLLGISAIIIAHHYAIHSTFFDLEDVNSHEIIAASAASAAVVLMVIN